MSWRCLPEQVEAYLDLDFWAGAPAAPSKLKPTAKTCSSNDSETDTLSRFRSGIISKHSTDTPGEESSTLSLVDFPAKIFPAQDAVKDLAAHAQDFGLKCCESLEKFNLRMSSPKTPRCYALEDSRWYSKGLPAWGMMRAGVCLELGTSVRPINETECGSLLPTPTGAGNENSPSMQKWRAHRALAAMLPAPMARDYSSPSPGERARKPPELNRVAPTTGGAFIALREWMMGWPTGWSGLSVLATDRFQEWLRSHGKY